MAEKKPKKQPKKTKKVLKAKKVSEKSEIKGEKERIVESKRHVMVPKHEILPEKDAAELLESFNVTRAQLPIILVDDPALKGLETKSGDVIKITREGSVIGTSFAYRVVTIL
jgi:DNA-directed RNA polymerase subunit H